MMSQINQTVRNDMMEKLNALLEHFPELASNQKDVTGLTLGQLRWAVYNRMLYVDNSGQFKTTALHTFSSIKQAMAPELQ